LGTRDQNQQPGGVPSPLSRLQNLEKKPFDEEVILEDSSLIINYMNTSATMQDIHLQGIIERIRQEIATIKIV